MRQPIAFSLPFCPWQWGLVCGTWPAYVHPQWFLCWLGCWPHHPACCRYMLAEGMRRCCSLGKKMEINLKTNLEWRFLRLAHLVVFAQNRVHSGSMIKIRNFSPCSLMMVMLTKRFPISAMPRGTSTASTCSFFLSSSSSFTKSGTCTSTDSTPSWNSTAPAASAEERDCKAWWIFWGKL